jgi:hypothetical protein
MYTANRTRYTPRTDFPFRLHQIKLQNRLLPGSKKGNLCNLQQETNFTLYSKEDWLDIYKDGSELGKEVREQKFISDCLLLFGTFTINH